MSGKKIPSSFIWQIIGASVRGANHLRHRIPNQDAILFSPKHKAGSTVFLAISDGHGSERSFRSQQGAKFAVRAARFVCRDILRSYCQTPQNLQKEEMLAIARYLPNQIVTQWRKMVENHLIQYPFQDEEKHLIDNENVFLVYGATLLIVLISENFILYAQLGDGDILTVSNSNEVNHPLPTDERLFANETTSLCMPDAENNFRIKMEIIESPPPVLILAASDGYANSFLKESGFLQVSTDLLTAIRQEGIDKVRYSLPTWLNETSIEGSGDDITAGIVYREEIH